MFDEFGEFDGFGELEDECEIEILHEVYSAAATQDAHGNTIPGYLSPAPVLVWGWEPPRSDEPFVHQHDDRVVINMLLYAPRSMKAKARDRVLLGGAKYELIGIAGDPNNNPWFRPGLVTYNLKRVEG